MLQLNFMNRNKIFYSAVVAAGLFLIVDFFVHGKENAFQFLVVSAIFNLIYISGWMFSVRELYLSKANGNTLFAKNTFELQLSLFFIANACNILVMLEANEYTYFSRMCSFFWITSNVFMTITAIIAFNANNVGWNRRVMTLAAIWVPLSLLVLKLLRNSMVYSIVIVLYPTLACLLVGYIATSPEVTREENKCSQRRRYRSQKKYMLAIN